MSDKKSLTAVELRKKNKDEVKVLLKEKRRLLTKLQFKKAMKQVDDIHAYRKAKRDIARILTVLKEM